MKHAKKFCLFLALALTHASIAMMPNTFIASIAGFDVPANIAITSNGLYAYIVDAGSNSVLVINTNSSSPAFNTLIPAPSLVGVFNGPSGIAITPNNMFAYVTDTNSNSVFVIDTNPASPTFNTFIAAPNLSNIFNGPNTIAITPNGLYAYVTNSNNLSVNVIDINPQSPTYNTVLVTPGLNAILQSPSDIAITPDGHYAYITNLSASVSVIDTNPSSPTYNTLLTTISGVNPQPEGLAITANGLFAYVANSAGVSVIDTNPASPTFNMILSTPNLGSAFFDAPNGVTTSPDGNYAYVSNFLGASGSVSSVTVIDTNPASPTYNSTLNTPGLVVVGPPFTRFVTLAITPDARYVYALDAYNNTVNVIYTGIITAPLNVTGCKTANVFLLQTDLINRLTWSVPTLGITPAAYKIFRDASLTQLVATTTTLQYDDHNRLPSVNDTYYIVSVDAFGNTSSAATTTVTNPCS